MANVVTHTSNPSKRVRVGTIYEYKGTYYIFTELRHLINLENGRQFVNLGENMAKFNKVDPGDTITIEVR